MEEDGALTFSLDIIISEPLHIRLIQILNLMVEESISRESDVMVAGDQPTKMYTFGKQS